MKWNALNTVRLKPTPRREGIRTGTRLVTSLYRKEPDGPGGNYRPVAAGKINYGLRVPVEEDTRSTSTC
ncbi:MAG: hypothetical protein QOJ42_2681 [Acidobacteriaceae bacterium]|jgi:hypothetical protein|nr:hypothetical protein [Acidobacteriaceae bacterium]MDX6456578.1 hypothetical protein [Acidobacteriaceae bacterium]MEA3007111.1 hypothetical protein [Acidobacteriaceae bacterium]